MNNFWTVGVDANQKIFLEHEAKRVRLYLEGEQFTSHDDKISYASNLAREFNGTL